MLKNRNAEKKPGLSRVAAACLIVGVLLCLLSPEAMAQGGETSSNLRGWLGVDLFGMIRSSDILGKLCMLVLALFSLASWAVIIYKYLHIRQAIHQTEMFRDVCNSGSGRLDEAFKAAKDFPDSPLAQILSEGYQELQAENWYREGYNIDTMSRIDMAKIGIERVFDRTITNEISHLERNLSFLATTTSVCPFIGLFGTVWGIMVAFQSFGLSGTVSLASLAPGLSTALLTTVGGLFCAIPSSIFYNILTTRVRTLTAQMDAFALELSNIVQKQILAQTAQQARV